MAGQPGVQSLSCVSWSLCVSLAQEQRVGLGCWPTGSILAWGYGGVGLPAVLNCFHLSIEQKTLASSLWAPGPIMGL